MLKLWVWTWCLRLVLLNKARIGPCTLASKPFRLGSRPLLPSRQAVFMLVLARLCFRISGSTDQQPWPKAKPLLPETLSSRSTNFQHRHHSLPETDTTSLPEIHTTHFQKTVFQQHRLPNHHPIQHPRHRSPPRSPILRQRAPLLCVTLGCKLLPFFLRLVFVA